MSNGLKLFKIACLSRKRTSSPLKGITEGDIELFEQYIFPQNIVAICPLNDEDKLPNAECLIVLSSGNTFQTTESLSDLVDRVNDAVKEPI